MFDPKYTITQKLLSNIKRIGTLIFELNSKRFPKVVLHEMEKTAREVSAYASTSIEGNPLPITEVKKIIKQRPAHIRESEREVLNYNDALVWLNASFEKTMKFDLKLLLQIHKAVTQGLLPRFRCGKVRTEAVFVNGPQSGETIYWPPDASEVDELLKQLFGFVKEGSEKFDPLIIAGIFHKQFVLIHPFMDGNGRTVRLVTKVLLARMGLDTFNLFSFENYYNKNVSKYFQFVGERGNYYDIVHHIDFTAWLEYFTDGIIDELLRVSQVLQNTSISPENVLRPHHEVILRHLKEHGFITDKIYSTLTARAKPTRNQDFNKLIVLKMIERVGQGKATLYRLP